MSCIAESDRRARLPVLPLLMRSGFRDRPSKVADHHPDSRIQHHQAELDAVRNSGARMITLASDEARGTWAQLEVFMSQWRAIEWRLEEPGPFICTASRTVLREVDLT